MRTVLATAADARYGFHLLSMIGSVQRNADEFDAIVAFDLGLSVQQRRLLDAIQGVEVRHVPPFSPHWAQGFTWKPWIWTHLDADRVFYLDAGAMVLRTLEPVLAGIRQRGYWVVSQGHHADALFPSEWYALYDIDPHEARRFAIAAGIIGFATTGRFWDTVVVPTYEDCLAGRSLGFSAPEMDRLNIGLGRLDTPLVRDAQLFRHDQSVLNARFIKAYRDTEAVVADLHQYAGFRSPRDHPEQVIWSHRRAGDFRYLGRARYRLSQRVRAKLLAARLRGPRVLSLGRHVIAATIRRAVLRLRVAGSRRPPPGS